MRGDVQEQQNEFWANSFASKCNHRNLRESPFISTNNKPRPYVPEAPTAHGPLRKAPSPRARPGHLRRTSSISRSYAIWGSGFQGVRVWGIFHKKRMPVWIGLWNCSAGKAFYTVYANDVSGFDEDVLTDWVASNFR